MSTPVVYLSLSQASRKAFLFPANARQSVNASGACDKELETNRLAGFCVEETMFKKCNRCGNWKLFTEFRKDKIAKSGCTAGCKDCLNKEAREKYSSDPVYRESIQKSNRESAKNDQEGARARSRKWYSVHADKANKYIREYRQANPEIARATQRKWNQANLEKKAEASRNRRAKVKGNGGIITAQEWQALKEFYNFTCLRCKRVEPEISLALDHVVPIVLGGINVIENAQPLCLSCNSSKGIKVIDYR